MSMFIGLLAFPTSPELQNVTKLGVLLGFALPAVTGAGLLRMTNPERGFKPVQL